MKLILEEFHPRHLEHLEAWNDRQFSSHMAKDEAYLFALYAASVLPDNRSSCAYSAFTEDGEFLGSLGFIPYPGTWKTTAEVWMFIDTAWAKYLKTCHRFVKERVDLAMELHGFRRLSVYVDVADKRAQRWIESLGFQCETKPGGLRKHGPDGQSYHLYGRIR